MQGAGFMGQGRCREAARSPRGEGPLLAVNKLIRELARWQDDGTYRYYITGSAPRQC